MIMEYNDFFYQTTVSVVSFVPLCVTIVVGVSPHIIPEEAFYTVSFNEAKYIGDFLVSRHGSL